ncbi:hypothetical protein FGRMN_10765 [Fusarium graminum]|nr:hypothetical protein FGRMN_10765 [Fusarium graminum]
MTTSLEISLAIPKGSIALVTGVNSFIGSHIADDFLSRGYNVRGTARNISTCAWINVFFDQKYGSDRFTLFAITDLTSPESFDQAVKGVSAVVHVASPLGHDTSVEKMIPDAVASAMNALNASNRETSVKRFVFTSSSTAAASPQPEVTGIVVTKDSWNHKALSMVQESTTLDWYTAYAASKVAAERAVWDFYHNDPARRSDLVVNTVLPSTTFGKSLDQAHQGHPSTSGFIQSLWNGTNIDWLKTIPPQYFVDIQDNALIHVACTLLSTVQGERIFAWVEPWNFDAILGILRQQNPHRAFVQNFQSGHCSEDVRQPKSRSIQLLGTLGKSRFTSLEESIRLNSEGGFMLDTGRKFFPVKAILHLLAILQQYNYNVFHWHIYDAESFPILWPAYQGLTDTSVEYSDTDTYYTFKDIQNVVKYGQSLGINVYPETDMPGHADIFGVWRKDLVVGKADLDNPEAQLDIRTNKPKTYKFIKDLVTTTDKYFNSSLHHFGGDEVSYFYNTKDDNKLFSDFLNGLPALSPNKSVILWDDPLTDSEKNVNISKDWIIQTWHNGVTSKVLKKGHRVIVSEANTFYIGNADPDKIAAFKFPNDPKVLGFEVVWFTSQDDDPYDFEQDFVMDPIKAASKLRRKKTKSTA